MCSPIYSQILCVPSVSIMYMLDLFTTFVKFRSRLPLTTSSYHITYSSLSTHSCHRLAIFPSLDHNCKKIDLILPNFDFTTTCRHLLMTKSFSDCPLKWPTILDLLSVLSSPFVIFFSCMIRCDAVHTFPCAEEFKYERIVHIFSFSKSFGIPGWRVGYALFPPSLLLSLRKVCDR